MRHHSKLLSILLLLIVLTPQISSAQHLGWFDAYLYMTHIENSRLNEIIWFSTYNRMHGPVHSNDTLGLKYEPRFYGAVRTSASEFLIDPRHGADPWFAFEPQFNVPEVDFGLLEDAMMMQKIRASETGSCYLDDGDPPLQSRLTGGRGGWRLQQWTRGVPYDSTIISFETTIPYGADLSIYIEVELIH